MGNPKRWIEDEKQPEIARLLRAAHRELPPRRAVERTVLLLGTTAAATALTTGLLGAATAKAASSSLGWAFAKWGTVAVLGLTVATTTVVVVRRPMTLFHASSASSGARTNLSGRARSPALPRANDQNNSDSEVREVTRDDPNVERVPVPAIASGAVSGPADVPLPPLNTARAVARFPDESPSEDRKMADTVVAGTGSGAVAARSSTDAQLLRELRWIDSARAALSKGSPNQALTILDDYGQKCSSPRLLPEALLLRMQAAVRLNDRGGAVRTARELMARFPNSPHALKARELLNH